MTVDTVALRALLWLIYYILADAAQKVVHDQWKLCCHKVASSYFWDRRWFHCS